MRKTFDSRAVTRQVGHVEKARPAPGPACDLISAREASPIRGTTACRRGFSQPWKTLRAATQFGTLARNLQGWEVVAERLWPKRTRWEVQSPSRQPNSWLLVQLLRDMEPWFRHPICEETRPQSPGAEHGSSGGNLPSLPSTRVHSSAWRCASLDPPNERGRVAASRTSSVHWSKSAWRMSDKHYHKLWSWCRANSSTAEGPTTLNWKHALAAAQCSSNNQADWTSATEGMRCRRSWCSAETHRKWAATKSEWPRGVPKIFTPC